MRNRAAANGVTVMLDCVPVAEVLALSLTVTDWLPAVFSVALNACVPRSAWVKA